MSFCAKTRCEIYRNKRFCRTATEKEKDGVCDCRHAVYSCEAGELCFMTRNCHAAPDKAKTQYAIAKGHFQREDEEAANE